LLRDLPLVTFCNDVVSASPVVAAFFQHAWVDASHGPNRNTETAMNRSRFAVAIAFAAASAAAFAQAPAAPEVRDMRAKLSERFGAADVDHDGKLTRDEAAAKMPIVARNFDQIDKAKKGYVTLEDIQAFARERAATRHAAKAAPTT
jgi:hypothetical protein